MFGTTLQLSSTVVRPALFLLVVSIAEALGRLAKELVLFQLYPSPPGGLEQDLLHCTQQGRVGLSYNHRA